MLYGIGCDLCELAHLEKSLTGAHAAAFVRRVYGEAERAALGLDALLPAGRSAAHRLASAAANFAAKEAFLKAAGTGLREPFFALRDRSHPAGKRRTGLSLQRKDGRMGAGPQPDRPALPEPRRRHGAGVLYTGNGNLSRFCAYNGISPVLPAHTESRRTMRRTHHIAGRILQMQGGRFHGGTQRRSFFTRIFRRWWGPSRAACGRC